jgi:oligosaccharide repeat unit polymerase
MKGIMANKLSKITESSGYISLISLGVESIFVAIISYRSIIAINSPTAAYYIFFVIALLAICRIYSYYQEGRINPFSPLVLFTTLVFLGYILPIPSFVNAQGFIGRGEIVWPFAFYDIGKSIEKSLFVLIIAIIGFFIGTIHPLQAMKFRKTREIQRKRLKFAVLIVSGAGFSLFMTGVMLIGGPLMLISGLSDRIRTFAGLNYFFIGLMFLPCSCLIWWNFMIKNNKYNDKIFWFVAILSILLSGLLGSKGNTFVTVLAAIISWNMIHKKIPYHYFIMSLFFGFIALNVFDLFFREYLILGQIVTLKSTDFAGIISEFAERSLGSIFFQIQILTIIIDSIPSKLELQYGGTFVHLFTAMIPSFLWSEKPLPAPGILTIALWPSSWYLRGTTMPPSLLGDFYMNFLEYGVFFGMYFFGLSYNFLYKYVKSNSYSIFSVSLYSIYVSLMLFFLRGDFADATVLFILLSFPIILTQIISNYRTKTRYNLQQVVD